MPATARHYCSPHQEENYNHIIFEQAWKFSSLTAINYLSSSQWALRKEFPTYNVPVCLSHCAGETLQEDSFCKKEIILWR